MIPVLSQRARGFSLIETLVAIAILMIAIVGPYYSIQQAITTSYVARDELIASQLAQEGQEYIYFRRDTNYLSSLDWLAGLDECRVERRARNTSGCSLDPSTNTISSCTAQGCPALKLQPNGLYVQTGSFPDTRFVRTVNISSVNPNEVKVVVTVKWVTSHRNLQVTTVENLYNWI